MVLLPTIATPLPKEKVERGAQIARRAYYSAFTGCLSSGETIDARER